MVRSESGRAMWDILILAKWNGFCVFLVHFIFNTHLVLNFENWNFSSVVILIWFEFCSQHLSHLNAFTEMPFRCRSLGLALHLVYNKYWHKYNCRSIKNYYKKIAAVTISRGSSRSLTKFKLRSVFSII